MRQIVRRPYRSGGGMLAEAVSRSTVDEIDVPAQPEIERQAKVASPTKKVALHNSSA
jgi:hypothetical protein